MSLLKPISEASLSGATGKLEFSHSAPETTLAEFYWSWFEARVANTDELRDTVFRLRYRVYCVENPFEDPSANPDGREVDEYDHHSAHGLLTYRPTGVPAGTVRLILPTTDNPGQSFAVQRVCSDPFFHDPTRFPVQRTAEISRFCISKEFRRRWTDGPCAGGEFSDGVEISADEERRLLPHLSLGLMESLVRMSVENGITHWCTVMEPTLLRLLSRLGIHFGRVGSLIEYHGRRQPCFSPIDTVLQRIRRERPDVWDVVTCGGRHSATLSRLLSEQPLRDESCVRSLTNEASRQAVFA